MSKYDSIRAMPHHVSRTHPPMSNYKRAAQFSSFDALTGFDECIAEEARLTDTMREMTEDRANALDAAMQRLLELDKPTVKITYFQPDTKKNGGEYVTYTGGFRFFDIGEEKLKFVDGKVIPLKWITDITIK